MGIKVVQSDKPGMINVSCWAFDVFPLPSLSLFHGQNGLQPLDEVEMNYERRNSTIGYNVWAWRTMEEVNITAISNVFECELNNSVVNHSRRESTLYEPDSMALRDSRSANGGASTSGFGLLVSSLIVFLIAAYRPPDGITQDHNLEK
ncbi:unnamed protein product [Allacma fusca]|uniref:Uncharacterized protein n=1 Tax=Allacma fusca TaxID=39272 RepID=A0A8J2NYG9_9HEXA|nr:unnamed protein product [Allacma fusca]